MSHSHFSPSERSEIQILLSKGYSHRSIATALGRSQSSISREIKYNSTHGVYNAKKAKHKAYVKRHLSKYQGMKIREHPLLQAFIIEKLKEHWTPEGIAGHLKEQQSVLPSMSSKGIYKWLYSAYGQKYCHLLPKQRHKPKKRGKKKTKRTMIPNRVGIERRPVTADLRTHIGHLETDTMVSGKKTGSKAALTLLHDRKSRYTKLKKINNLRPITNREALEQLGEQLYCVTITHDNGIENKQHEQLAINLNVQTYFCDPYSSWQKGSVENTIGRIRRFIPKGADVSLYSDSYIQQIEDWLNHTPRKCLDFKTPHQVYFENLDFISSSSSDAFQG
jgi:transposase, IS30 family